VLQFAISGPQSLPQYFHIGNCSSLLVILVVCSEDNFLFLGFYHRVDYQSIGICLVGDFVVSILICDS
jgi:hypothetical protein